jgi:tetratricopeptide (TPR) repeat protein
MKRAALLCTFAIYFMYGCEAAPVVVSPQPTEQQRELVRQVLAGRPVDLSPQQLIKQLEPFKITPAQPRKGFARDAELAMAQLYEQTGQLDRTRAIYLAAIDEHRRTGSALSLPLANALYRYAEMEADAGRLQEAVTLVDESVKIHQRRDRFGNEQQLAVMNLAALLRTYLGQDQQALAIHGKAIKLHPAMSAGYAARAMTHTLNQRYEQAQVDLDSAFGFKQTPMNNEVNIFWFVQLRSQGPAIAHISLGQVVGQLYKKERAGLDAQITYYLLGEISQADLLAQANAPSIHLQRRDRCAVWFYIAMKHESENDLAKAREYYTHCIAKNTMASPYYYLAQAASIQLTPSP